MPASTARMDLPLNVNGKVEFEHSIVGATAKIGAATGLRLSIRTEGMSALRASYAAAIKEVNAATGLTLSTSRIGLGMSEFKDAFVSHMQVIDASSLTGSPLVFTSAPNITGTPTVGQPLSALTFTDGVVSGGSITARSILLAGTGVAASYVLQPADVGKSVVYRNAAGAVVRDSAGVAVVSAAGETGTVSLSEAVTRTGDAYSFRLIRSGDLSGPKTQTWAVAPTALTGRIGALPADFGGAFPSGTASFAPGESLKTITVTTASAQPE